MRKVLLSGNEALARGAYEAGVCVATGYPGTPSSEILETIAREYRDEIYVEWSTNEKVALDAAIGAAYSGCRALVTTKQVGMNVFADSLMYAVYTGLEAALVIVTADDPGMFSSQNEQDNRWYAKLAKLPLLEPSDSQEAKDFVIYATQLSEQFDTPVLIRTTMRVSHSKSVVALGEKCADAHRKRDKFPRNPRKYVMMALWARERHPVVEERMRALAHYAHNAPINRVEYRDHALGIITSGVVYTYAREVFPNASVLKLGMTYPLPRDLIIDFARNVEKVIVIEELDPFLEEQIRAMGVDVIGKDVFPPCGELLPDRLAQAAAEAGLLKEPAKKSVVVLDGLSLPERVPVFCPGCPHRSTFFVLAKLKVPVAGDIGCYNLGCLPPFNAQHTMGCMGASIGVLHGIAISGLPEKGVATIGDSTFFHSGMAPLINMVHNKSQGVVIVMDNGTTAMTGHQDHPGTSWTLRGQPAPQIDIENIVRAMGVQKVVVVNAFNVAEIEKGIKECLAYDGVSVVITRGLCVQISKHYAGAYKIDEEACIACGTCFRLGCPAIIKTNVKHPKTGRYKAAIDQTLCTGCDLCRQVCPAGAISQPSQERNNEKM
ncbi:MAG: indolepyruvate ferredoxin oxidoreductase subunit alpha [Candidatus Methanomethyliaceae archaeon]